MAKRKRGKKKPPPALRPLPTLGTRPAGEDALPALGWPAGLLGNLLIVAGMVYAGVLNRFAPDTYYRALQEDSSLEWATVWAFLAAAAIFLAAAVHRRRAGRQWPWFLTGLSLFCLFVALEEISWGQRLLGYRPPAYFLERNYQQELNIHNVFDTSLRKLALKSVIVGYGVLLPIVAWSRGMRRTLGRLGVVASPLALIPGFLVTYLLYDAYPWKFSGEVVELMLGMGFAVAAVAAFQALRSDPPAEGHRRLAKLMPYVVVGVAVALLGRTTEGLSRLRLDDGEEIVGTARLEAEALANDFLALAAANGGRPATKCNVHKRVYTYIEQYDRPELHDGTFSALTARGLPEERAAFFIDPWNTAYWIRHRCSRSSGREKAFIYSFGPDRQRNSSEWEVLGDDVGVVIYDKPADAR